MPSVAIKHRNIEALPLPLWSLAPKSLVTGTLEPLSLELGIPVDHLEHPDEFGDWLDYLRERFQVEMDADDRIILFLYQNAMLLKGQEIQENNRLILKSKSDRIFSFLSERSQEIDTLIRGLPGYIGSREMKDEA